MKSSTGSAASSEAVRRSWQAPAFTKIAVGTEAGLGSSDAGQTLAPPASEDSAKIRKSGRNTEHVYPYLRNW